MKYCNFRYSATLATLPESVPRKITSEKRRHLSFCIKNIKLVIYVPNTKACYLRNCDMMLKLSGMFGCMENEKNKGGIIDLAIKV